MQLRTVRRAGFVAGVLCLLGAAYADAAGHLQLRLLLWIVAAALALPALLHAFLYGLPAAIEREYPRTPASPAPSLATPTPLVGLELLPTPPAGLAALPAPPAGLELLPAPPAARWVPPARAPRNAGPALRATRNGRMPSPRPAPTGPRELTS